jgi:hypothetical protein
MYVYVHDASSHMVMGPKIAHSTYGDAYEQKMTCHAKLLKKFGKSATYVDVSCENKKSPANSNIKLPLAGLVSIVTVSLTDGYADSVR